MSDRDEQLGAGFSDITCRDCGTTAEVRKVSPAQTSIQWSPGPACPLLVRDEYGTPAEGCPRMRESIRAAVEAGLLPVGPR